MSQSADTADADADEDVDVVLESISFSFSPTIVDEQMQSQCDSGCVDLKNNEELCSLSLVDTVIPDQCANGLPQFEMKSCFFPAATSEILRNSICIFFGCFKTKKIICILVISVTLKYFQMLPIQILPPLLFTTDFPGYSGLQYVHDFLVF
jgi:hypothetical protein